MKITLREYIEKNTLTPIASPIRQYDETNYQLYDLLDAIGFAGKMGYNDRALIREWLSQIGLPMKEIELHVREALKNPHYSKARQ